ncbi:MAG TPA: septum formation initiator family protein [Gemmatimonadales bacterium]|nr:septum formation initiator family protein [Gemmatimonadales bacterium]
MSRAGWAAVVVLLLLAFLAVQGGEYTTGDYFELKRRLAVAEQEAARLAAAVDSLKRMEKAVLTDPAVQERIAREEFGMIRSGEYLYKVTEPEP